MIPVLLLAVAAGAADADLKIPHEQLKLENGLQVILHEDHTLPQVVINLWYGVGAKDELAGRSGFAHMFEHLMFMGTTRLPDSGFDDLMEAEGGWNNAWTSEDATDYYSVGPSRLLGTLLWMDADRMEGLAGAMTQDKLDLQREVVRNERRQRSEDTPYGGLWLALPGAMYPTGHPYAHPVIGSHSDLEAATLQDVVDFFETWYVPNNASLVIAGDFDSAEIMPLVKRTFGSIPSGKLPARKAPADVTGPAMKQVELTDQVRIPMSTMVWHTPKAMADGDAELDLLSNVLAGGRSSRLYQRLVATDGIALEVDAGQNSQLHQSLFMIQSKPADGQTLDAVEAVILEEIAKLAVEGPTDAELERAKNQVEVGFIQSLESLQGRASALNRYSYLAGTPDYLAKDVARYRAATAEGLKAAAARLTADAVGVLRIMPETTEGGE